MVVKRNAASVSCSEPTERLTRPRVEGGGPLFAQEAPSTSACSSSYLVDTLTAGGSEALILLAALWVGGLVQQCHQVDDTQADEAKQHQQCEQGEPLQQEAGAAPQEDRKHLGDAPVASGPTNNSGSFTFPTLNSNLLSFRTCVGGREVAELQRDGCLPCWPQLDFESDRNSFEESSEADIDDADEVLSLCEWADEEHLSREGWSRRPLPAQGGSTPAAQPFCFMALGHSQDLVSLAWPCAYA